MEKITQKTRDEMILSNVRWVKKIAGKYQGVSFLNKNDLESEGLLGLIKAVDSYDPKKGIKLITYATPLIKQSILDAINKYGQTIPLPKYKRTQLNKYKKAVETITKEYGSPPNHKELSVYLGFKVKLVKELEELAARTVDGLEIKPHGNDDSAGEYDIPDDRGLDPWSILLKKESKLEGNRILNELSSGLSKNEKKVIKLYLKYQKLKGNDKEKRNSWVLDEIKKETNIPRHQIRVLIAAAERKLKNEFNRRLR